jgi:hypothetical protein
MLGPRCLRWPIYLSGSLNFAVNVINFAAPFPFVLNAHFTNMFF